MTGNYPAGVTDADIFTGGTGDGAFHDLPREDPCASAARAVLRRAATDPAQRTLRAQLDLAWRRSHRPEEDTRALVMRWAKDTIGLDTMLLQPPAKVREAVVRMAKRYGAL